MLQKLLHWGPAGIALIWAGTTRCGIAPALPPVRLPAHPPVRPAHPPAHAPVVNLWPVRLVP